MGIDLLLESVSSVHLRKCSFLVPPHWPKVSALEVVSLAILMV